MDEGENQASDGRFDGRCALAEKPYWRSVAPTSWSHDMADDLRRGWSDPVIEVYKRDVDRSLLRENLKRTYEERFLTLKQMQRFSAELRRAMREARRQS